MSLKLEAYTYKFESDPDRYNVIVSFIPPDQAVYGTPAKQYAKYIASLVNDALKEKGLYSEVE